MASPKIQLELLPWECEVLLKWINTPDVRSQLEALSSTNDVGTITITRVELHWLAGDLTHAIVKRGCSDDDAFDLSERLDYAEQTGDGRLDSWYSL